mmetsp:Transcript_11432/g.51755  ORF Transcript_11432/g.51755 Transcript_11432/m.51755 type:complete len:600 (-) Transcript_11432:336-2135(-)
MLTSWGGVFPPMHPVHAVEDGEHKRKREDELDLSIREGAEGECATPQNRALAQRRRRFAKSPRDAPEVKVRGVLEYLRARGASVGRQSQRYSALRQSAQARTALVTRQPYCLKERAAPREVLRGFDKCFAAAWLDDDRCVVGTKDNKLAIVRAANLGAPAVEVKLPRRLFEPVVERRSRTTRPLRPLRPPPPPVVSRVESRVDDAVARVRAAANHEHHALNATNANDAAVNVVRRVHFRGDARDVVAEEMDRIRAGAPHAPIVGAGLGWARDLITRHADNCGIHAVAINASRTRMATGAANPADAAVFSLPDVRPTALLTGHADWVFGLDWVTDNLLASGSRDGTVKLWTVPDEPGGYGRGSRGVGHDDDRYDDRYDDPVPPVTSVEQAVEIIRTDRVALHRAEERASKAEYAAAAATARADEADGALERLKRGEGEDESPAPPQPPPPPPPPFVRFDPFKFVRARSTPNVRRCPPPPPSSSPWTSTASSRRWRARTVTTDRSGSGSAWELSPATRLICPAETTPQSPGCSATTPASRSGSSRRRPRRRAPGARPAVPGSIPGWTTQTIRNRRWTTKPRRTRLSVRCARRMRRLSEARG